MNDTQTSARQRRKKPSKTVALRRAEMLAEKDAMGFGAAMPLQVAAMR